MAGWAWLQPASAQARDADAAANRYGQAVHAYFAGRASDAESLLSRCLEQNGNDPRFYYFRALARLRMGRADEARRDMAEGAAREARRPNRYAVGAALQRVQGRDRLLLEQYRSDARAKAGTVGAEVARQRAEQMTARDEGALRQRVIIPLDELFRPGGPRPLSADEFARRAEQARYPQPVPAAAPAEIERPAPAGPAAAAVPAPPEDNPFQDDSPQPQAEPPSAADSQSTPAPDAAPENESDDNPFDF
jgi:hypothetical protein